MQLRPSAVQLDREVAAEKTLQGLRISWKARIEDAAIKALRGGDFDQAVEAVEEKLFKSEQWQNVPATVISDIAYEAVCAAQ